MKPLEIGHLSTESNGKKDAIHVPVVSVTAGELLSPGEMVTVYRQGAQFKANKAVVGVPDGIVDPFLNQDVQPEENFWLFLQPGSVNDLRHEWETSTFPAGKVLNPHEEADFTEYLNDSCRGCY